MKKILTLSFLGLFLCAGNAMSRDWSSEGGNQYDGSIDSGTSYGSHTGYGNNGGNQYGGTINNNGGGNQYNGTIDTGAKHPKKKYKNKFLDPETGSYYYRSKKCDSPDWKKRRDCQTYIIKIF
jgi:hypothetical protein